MEHKSSVTGARLVQALMVRSQPVDGTEDRTLFNQGEPPTGLYLLQSGEATLFMKSHTGQTVMCRQAGSGSLLGLPGMIGNEPYTLTAILRKGSVVRFITREDFVQTIEQEPGLYLCLLEMLAMEVRLARLALAAK